MSYCVHCGVELASSEKECPLCHTPVVDPQPQNTDNEESIFPSRLDPDDFKKVNVRFLVFVIGLVLLIPLVAVIVINLLVSHNLSWSLYVLGAEACLWSFFVLPLNYRLKVPYLYILADTIVVGCYLALIWKTSGTSNWYWPLGLPLVLATGVYALFTMAIVRNRKINRLEMSGWTITLQAIYMAAVDMIIYHFLTGMISLSWSWYVAVPLLICSIVIIIFSRSATIQEWIHRNLFV